MSHHKQPHQHQPHNPLSAAQPVQTTSMETPSAAKPKACTPGADACRCQPSADHIRARAYEISQARNGGTGNATSDWSQAEKELTATSAAKA